jgi:RNA polymerase-binding transcription factor DksA
MSNFPDTDDTMDKITDPSDLATQREQENLDISLKEHARAMRRSQELREDGTYEIEECLECGNEIGLGRLMHAIKNTLCIHCATAAEKRMKGIMR